MEKKEEKKLKTQSHLPLRGDISLRHTATGGRRRVCVSTDVCVVHLAFFLGGGEMMRDFSVICRRLPRRVTQRREETTASEASVSSAAYAYAGPVLAQGAPVQRAQQGGQGV